MTSPCPLYVSSTCRMHAHGYIHSRTPKSIQFRQRASLAKEPTIGINAPETAFPHITGRTWNTQGNRHDGGVAPRARGDGPIQGARFNMLPAYAGIMGIILGDIRRRSGLLRKPPFHRAARRRHPAPSPLPHHRAPPDPTSSSTSRNQTMPEMSNFSKVLDFRTSHG